MLLDSPNLDKVAYDCWEPESTQKLGNADILRERTLSAEEELTRTYELWGSPTDESCMPTGKFTFRQGYEFAESNKRFHWSFTLAVKSISE